MGGDKFPGTRKTTSAIYNSIAIDNKLIKIIISRRSLKPIKPLR